MRILLLHNPQAGDADHEPRALAAAFRAHGHEVTWRNEKTGRVDLQEAAAADVVIVAGGDGTVGRAVRGLGRHCRRLSVLPLGSANNLAIALGLPSRPEAFAAALSGFAERALTVGLARGAWGEAIFLEGIGVGVLAETTAACKGSGLSGAEGLETARRDLRDRLEDAPALKCHAIADGVALAGPALMLEALVTPRTGPALRLGTSDALSDKLELVALRPDRRNGFRESLERNGDAPMAGLDRVTCRRASFDWTGGALRIDGEPLQHPGKTVRVEVSLADPLTVLVPPTAG